MKLKRNWEYRDDGENSPYIQQEILRYGDQDLPLIAQEIAVPEYGYVMAAAPELLACVIELKAELESALNLLLSEGIDTQPESDVLKAMLKRAEDAIAKAKGDV